MLCRVKHTVYRDPKVNLTSSTSLFYIPFVKLRIEIVTTTLVHISTVIFREKLTEIKFQQIKIILAT